MYVLKYKEIKAIKKVILLSFDSIYNELAIR